MYFPRPDALGSALKRKTQKIQGHKKRLEKPPETWQNQVLAALEPIQATQTDDLSS